jgi:hypothetical protein
VQRGVVAVADAIDFFAIEGGRAQQEPAGSHKRSQKQDEQGRRAILFWD